MTLLQRIRAPFEERGGDGFAAPEWGVGSIGAQLRERREELGLGLDAIGENLRIKPVYLDALERGATDELPGAAYAIGFVRAYAQCLGLDADQVLEAYKAESEGVHTRPDLTLPVPLDARSLPRGPILLVGVILALCGYGTWFYLSTGERSRPERVSAVPAELQRVLDPAAPPGDAAMPTPAGAAAPAAKLASGVLSPPTAAPKSAGRETGLKPDPAANAAAASPPRTAVTPAAAADKGRETAAAPPPPNAAAPAADAAKQGGRIDIKAIADCWIQVRSGEDQSIVFSRVLKAGETYHVPRGGLLLRTGNAGALELVVDGKPAPAIGGVGAMRRSVALDPQALLAGTAVRG